MSDTKALDKFILESRRCAISGEILILDNTQLAQAAAELVVAKHRNGACGKIDVYFHAETMKFAGLTQEAEPINWTG